MRYIKQKDYDGCGVACIAMLSGYSYNYVKKIAKENSIFQSNRGNALRAINLHNLGKLVGLKISKKKIKYKSLKQTPRLAILAIDYNNKNRDWHWIVLNKNEKEKYKDPFDKNRLFFRGIKHYLKVERVHD